MKILKVFVIIHYDEECAKKRRFTPNLLPVAVPRIPRNCEKIILKCRLVHMTCKVQFVTKVLCFHFPRSDLKIPKCFFVDSEFWETFKVFHFSKLRFSFVLRTTQSGSRSQLRVQVRQKSDLSPDYPSPDLELNPSLMQSDYFMKRVQRGALESQ